MKKVQVEMEEELRRCEEEIVGSRTRLQEEEEILVGKIGDIGKDLEDKLKKLK